MRITTTKPGQRRTEVRAEEPTMAHAEVEAYVTRFALPARRDIRRLVRASPRLGDLARVFPAAVHALATRRGPSASRLHAMSLVEQGAPLKSIARALDLPMWLRKLPPEAFAGTLGPLPTTETFARRIAARMPATAGESAFWLAAISFATAACHEDFAIWLAEQPVFAEAAEPARLFAVLAAYAWYSGLGQGRAHALIAVPWRREIAFDTAVCAAKSWLNRMRLVMQLRPGVVSDTWLVAGTWQDYSIHPLIEHREILEEAQAMHNCADQFSDRLSRDKCRLFSVRRGDLRVATIEIGPHPRETGVLSIVQLKARHNMPAPVEVWQAAYAWMAQQDGLRRMPALVTPERPLDPAIWDELMGPYRSAKTGAPWLVATPSLDAMQVFDADLGELARRGSVSSWLFT